MKFSPQGQFRNFIEKGKIPKYPSDVSKIFGLKRIFRADFWGSLFQISKDLDVSSYIN